MSKSLERLRWGLIDAFDEDQQYRAEGKPEKVYAAITAMNPDLSEASRGDIRVSVSHSKEPASPLGSANATANATTPLVAFEKVHPNTEPRPSSAWVEQVHPSPMRQPEPVAFEKSCDCNGFGECDNFGERVEEAPPEGDLDLATYDLEGHPCRGMR
jgi:hypothetical protein